MQLQVAKAKNPIGPTSNSSKPTNCDSLDIAMACLIADVIIAEPISQLLLIRLSSSSDFTHLS